MLPPPAYVPPSTEPDPLYKTMILSSLPRLHPVFHFAATRIDSATTIDFTVGFRDLVIDGRELNKDLGYPQMLGSFPGFVFDRDLANAKGFSVADQQKLFEQYLFKVVSRFLGDVVHQDSAGVRARAELIRGGQIQWDRVFDHLNQLTFRMRQFERRLRREGEVLDLFLVPLEWYVRMDSGILQADRAAYAVNAAGFDKEQLQKWVDSLIAEHSPDHANWKLKQHLLSTLTANLYHMCWLPL
jgi:hypothetical protein